MDAKDDQPEPEESHEHARTEENGVEVVIPTKTQRAVSTVPEKTNLYEILVLVKNRSDSPVDAQVVYEFPDSLEWEELGDSSSHTSESPVKRERTIEPDRQWPITSAFTTTEIESYGEAEAKISVLIDGEQVVSTPIEVQMLKG